MPRSHSQVESAEAVNKAYTANENIFNDLQASGPSNMPPAQIGTNVHCWNPVSTGWQYQLMDGSSGQDITVGVMFHGDNFMVWTPHGVNSTLFPSTRRYH